MNKKISVLMVIILIFSTLCGCSSSKENKVSKSGFYFDTVITITLYNTNSDSYINDCFDLAQKYENMFSNTIDSSDISKINSSAGQNAVTVSDDTITLINKAIHYSKLSNGALDITIGKLSDLWNFSEISKNINNDENITDSSVIPSENDINQAVSTIDYNGIVISGNDVMLKNPNSKLDLGAIAKGYIADKMKEYLNSKNVKSGIINLGGNVLTIGKKSDNSDYIVGIQKPFDQQGTTIAKLKISDKSVVTSGIDQRYYEVDGKIYHHILDTKTGYPVENDLLSVTIISDSSCDGDALSTTCYSLGKEKGMELIESVDNVEAVFITDDYEIIKSSGAKIE